MKPVTHQADAALRPRDTVTGEPIDATPQPGYYPGYSTLAQRAFWDAATRKVVVDRVDSPPPLRFFTPDQAKFWNAVFAHLIPQTDRTPDRQIPLLPPLDQRLHENRTVGYRFDDMPHDRDVYQSLGIQAINDESHARYGGDFLFLPHRQQDIVLRALHDGRPTAAETVWKQMSVFRFWQLILSDAIEAYYAHPWAWDEIGFGGPAYPRAYTRLERGEPEPWEVEEERYTWLGPQAAVSDDVENVAHHHTEAEQHRHQPPMRSE
jgi:hypothetical protein